VQDDPSCDEPHRVLVTLPRREPFQERSRAKFRGLRRGSTQQAPADRTLARKAELDSRDVLRVGEILRSEDLHRL
jgi:hypothetical protein